MPEGNEPVTPVSGQGQPDTKAAANALTKEQLQEIIAPIVGQQVTGAVKRHLMDAFKSDEFVNSLRGAMKDMVAQADAERQKKPPTDHEKLQAQIQTLEQRLQKTDEERQRAADENRKSKIENGISNLLNGLDGREGKPLLKASARTDLAKLLKDGNHLPSAPDVDESGNVIVREQDGTTRLLAEILSNGFFGEGHWALERVAFRGSGPHGISSGTTVQPTVRGKPWSQMVPGTTEYNMAVAESLQAAQGDPTKYAAILSDIQRQRLGG